MSMTDDEERSYRVGTNHDYIHYLIEKLEHPGGVTLTIDSTRNAGIAMVIRLLEEIRDEGKARANGLSVKGYPCKHEKRDRDYHGYYCMTCGERFGGEWVWKV